MPGSAGQLYPGGSRLVLPGLKNVRVYGHSGAAGTGLPNGAGKYSSRLASQLHTTESNLAVAGAVASHHDGNGSSRICCQSADDRRRRRLTKERTLFYGT